MEGDKVVMGTPPVPHWGKPCSPLLAMDFCLQIERNSEEFFQNNMYDNKSVRSRIKGTACEKL